MSLRQRAFVAGCLMVVLLSPAFFPGPILLTAWVFCRGNPAARGCFLKAAGWASVMEATMLVMMIAPSFYGWKPAPWLPLALILIFYVAIERMEKYLEMGCKARRQPPERIASHSKRKPLTAALPQEHL